MSIDESLFPNLNDYQLTSEMDCNYNCIAWAANINNAWWEPDGENYWPESAPLEFTVAALVSAYESLGFELCEEASLETGFEKVAVYGDESPYMEMNSNTNTLQDNYLMATGLASWDQGQIFSTRILNPFHQTLIL